MRQLFLDAKAGRVQLAEVPEPALRPGTVRVRNVISAISPGTERLTVSTARDSYLRTARNRPDLVRKVLDSVKREGLLAAYRKVQTKLAEPKALGYSCAGTVEAVGSGAEALFAVGDRVACAGAGVASHAEVVCVPVQLAARIPEAVDFEAAAFATLGAIALHGVRQSEPTLGERFAVIGLGIVGLLTVQLLRANGVRVAAFDLAPELVKRARALGAEVAVAGGTDEQVETALAWSEGCGVDGVIVTAASKSDAPMVAAAGMCRDRARVVAVGFVPFGLPREIAYVKELDLRISRSYGPGRYDPRYEEQGLDYPISYVRWTETRNLEAFLHLVAQGQVDMASMITHRYELADAVGAYEDLGSTGNGRPVGVVIRYPEPAEAPAPPSPVQVPTGRTAGAVQGPVGVAFIGAGGFARAVLLPGFRKAPQATLRHVVTANGLSARDAQQRFGFEHAGTDVDAALADERVHLVCVATRHDLHADLVVRALEAGKHVFVEKPLALDEAQLERVERAARASSGVVLVGFNRRFSPMAAAIREAARHRGPLMMDYRVNAGPLPDTHWLNDPAVGGGRMIGEGCHFVDLFAFLTGDAACSEIESFVVGRGRGTPQDFAVQLRFADGSVGQLLYASHGDSSMGKERLEVHGGGLSAVLDDYLRGEIRQGGRARKLKQAGKGHVQEIAALLEAVRRGGPAPIALDTQLDVTRATFEAARQFPTVPTATTD